MIHHHADATVPDAAAIAVARRVLPGVLSMLVLAGCTSIADEARSLGLPIENWQDVKPIPEPYVETVQRRHTVSFAAGSPALPPAERRSLTEFVAQLPAGGSETAYIVAAPGPWALTEQRIAAVGGVLDAAGHGWQPGILGDDAASVPAADEVALVVDLTVVALPPCPNWSDWPQSTFTNRPGSNFGCATAVNFGMLVADPEDLRRGRSLGYADGTVLSAAVERYRLGKTKDIVRDFGSSDAFPTSGGD